MSERTLLHFACANIRRFLFCTNIL